MPGNAHDQSDLSEALASERLKQDGPNELARSKPKSIGHLIREITTEPMFILLVSCGGIYMLLGNVHEALMLLGFVFVVMGITFVQQRRTERSLEALREMSSPRALVVRDGKSKRIAGRELVCGDIVLLSEGDRVPADICLVDSSNLMIDESMLTGESLPIAKQSSTTQTENSSTIIDNKTLVFSGTLITQGTARGYVIATGARSALGKIGKSLSEIVRDDTLIQRETRQIVKKIACIGILLACVLVVGYGLTHADWLKGLLTGITLAMAILPEELPVVLTLFMALSARRLANDHVLTRNMPAIEILGATTLLCVDKTGTLTLNKMLVRQLWSDTHHYHHAQTPGQLLPDALHALLEYAVLACHRHAFDPMESAITAAGHELLQGTEHLHTDWLLVRDYPLSRELLAMSRVWQSSEQGLRMIAAKGSPESIIDLCHLDAVSTSRIVQQVERMAREGLRIIGVAQVKFVEKNLPEKQHDFDFEFLGLVALGDPVRKEVPQAIEKCQRAGIRVVMITGDHPATAISIATQAGIARPDQVMTGAELDTLSQEEQLQRLSSTNVFCRVRPEQKLKLVQAFKDRGEIVAMTGDGVNDAPALKAAHIGVAMGARGTDVAREAASLVLLDDNFSSLVSAIKQGRRVFANLRKAIVFIIAVHLPVIGLSLLPVAFGWPILLMPVHILFLQLIIDPACSLVFEAEPLENDAMLIPPRSPLAHLFDSKILLRGFLQGIGLLVLLVGFYIWARSQTDVESISRAMLFTALVLSSLALIQSNRSWLVRPKSAKTIKNIHSRWITLSALFILWLVLEIPSISSLFAFAPLNLFQLAGCLMIALISFCWFEGLKRL